MGFEREIGCFGSLTVPNVSTDKERESVVFLRKFGNTSTSPGWERAELFLEEIFMKKSCLVINLAFLLTCFLFSLSHAQKVSGPVIVIPDRSFNFKVADEGTVIEHAFKVLNQGDAPLEIKDVRPD
jgi:hypothetical protein